MPPKAQVADQAVADVALLHRIVLRDAQALGDLYDRHASLLFGVVLRIVRNRDEAEEVLQEAFLQVWSRAASYQPALGSPTGWLVGIARHRAIDRVRARAVRDAAVSMAAADADAPVTIGDSGAPLDIRRALDRLPAEQRQLIEEAFFLGLTHTELAGRHHLPLGTVKTRIRTGMQALRGALDRRVIES